MQSNDVFQCIALILKSHNKENVVIGIERKKWLSNDSKHTEGDICAWNMYLFHSYPKNSAQSGSMHDHDYLGFLRWSIAIIEALVDDGYH